MYGWWIIEQNQNKYVTDPENNTVISLFLRTENTAMIAGLGKVKPTMYHKCNFIYYLIS